ncbi:MAG TPA: MBL fold metallo-hydrolase, partial [Bryobacteraceae bacterium]|nr:MBL fold metallo-hydrolase [Bryobacteraceae bacterium]
ERAEAQFHAMGLETDIVQPWEERTAGPFRIIGAPSVDGFGDPQRCGIVESGGTRILHAGDTLFHGYWWAIARAVGSIDVAFLPINGPVVELPHVQPPSPFEAAMLPEQAAVAAQILRARTAVPIHYGLLHKPPEYMETPRAEERFLERAKELGLVPRIVNRGEWFSPE